MLNPKLFLGTPLRAGVTAALLTAFGATWVYEGSKLEVYRTAPDGSDFVFRVVLVASIWLGIAALRGWCYDADTGEMRRA